MANESRTKRKLEEAQFFLEQLHKNYGKLKKFDYYLSAFISSGRSVTWVMVSEHEKTPGWQAWYDAREPDQEQQALLRGFTIARNRTVKVEPLQSIAAFTLKGIKVPKEDIPRFVAAMRKSTAAPAAVNVSGSGGEQGYVLEFEIDGEKHVYPATEIDIDRRLQEFPDSSALNVCVKYFEWLAALVAECESKFWTPRSTDADRN